MAEMAALGPWMVRPLVVMVTDSVGYVPAANRMVSPEVATARAAARGCERRGRRVQGNANTGATSESREKEKQARSQGIKERKQKNSNTRSSQPRIKRGRRRTQEAASEKK